MLYAMYGMALHKGVITFILQDRLNLEKVGLHLINVLLLIQTPQTEICVHNTQSSSVHYHFILFFLLASLGYGFFFATLLGNAKPLLLLFTVYGEIVCGDYLMELPVKADAFIS